MACLSVDARADASDDAVAALQRLATAELPHSERIGVAVQLARWATDTGRSSALQAALIIANTAKVAWGDRSDLRELAQHLTARGYGNEASVINALGAKTCVAPNRLHFCRLSVAWNWLALGRFAKGQAALPQTLKPRDQRLNAHQRMLGLAFLAIHTKALELAKIGGLARIQSLARRQRMLGYGKAALVSLTAIVKRWEADRRSITVIYTLREVGIEAVKLGATKLARRVDRLILAELRRASDVSKRFALSTLRLDILAALGDTKAAEQEVAVIWVLLGAKGLHSEEWRLQRDTLNIIEALLDAGGNALALNWLRSLPRDYEENDRFPVLLARAGDPGRGVTLASKLLGAGMESRAHVGISRALVAQGNRTLALAVLAKAQPSDINRLAGYTSHVVAALSNAGAQDKAADLAVRVLSLSAAMKATERAFRLQLAVASLEGVPTTPALAAALAAMVRSP